MKCSSTCADSLATPAPVIPNQTTEYNPQARPSATPNPLQNPPISPSGGASTPTTVQHPHTNGAPSNQNLPASNLPPVTAGSTHPKIDPSNPTGIIPSTGASVYEVDLNQFEGSGQPWRRPGSDLTDWFNFGFDEVTYPKFLRFRSEMEAGRQALVSSFFNACEQS
jgi:pre-mRNA 3'-end-processing factor FIP1